MNTATRLTAGLVSLVSLVAAPAALAAIDYSKNAAGGTYAPETTSPASPVSPDSGFAWGDAIVGAAVAVAAILIVVLAYRALSAARSRRELAAPGSGASAS